MRRSPFPAPVAFSIALPPEMTAQIDAAVVAGNWGSRRELFRTMTAKFLANELGELPPPARQEPDRDPEPIPAAPGREGLLGALGGLDLSPRSLPSSLLSRPFPPATVPAAALSMPASTASPNSREAASAESPPDAQGSLQQPLEGSGEGNGSPSAAATSDAQDGPAQGQYHVGHDEDHDDGDRAHQQQFLQALDQVYSPELACRMAGVPRELLTRWLYDRAFRLEAERCLEAFIARVELMLLQIGSGEKRGNASALSCWLAANSPNHGLVKQNYLRGLFEALTARIVDALKGEFNGPTLQRVMGKISAACQPILEKLPEVGPFEPYLQQPVEVSTEQPDTRRDPVTTPSAKPVTEAMISPATKATPTKRKTVSGSRRQR